MPTMRGGLVVAAIHLAIVGSIGGKLLFDRATRPRVWARTAPIDPDLPLRGRYVQLRVEGVAEGDAGDRESHPVVLSVENGALSFRQDPRGGYRLTARTTMREGRRVAVLDQRLAFFIPEHVPDPSVRQPGEELWVEVTIPKSGAPRPIRLGVKKDGVITPLDLK